MTNGSHRKNPRDAQVEIAPAKNMMVKHFGVTQSPARQGAPKQSFLSLGNPRHLGRSPNMDGYFYDYRNNAPNIRCGSRNPSTRAPRFKSEVQDHTRRFNVMYQQGALRPPRESRPTDQFDPWHSHRCDPRQQRHQSHAAGYEAGPDGPARPRRTLSRNTSTRVSF